MLESGENETNGWNPSVEEFASSVSCTDTEPDGHANWKEPELVAKDWFYKMDRTENVGADS